MRIGQRLGEVVEVDSFLMRGKEDRIMKVRVNLDVTRTLRQSIKISSPDKIMFEIMLKYEKIGIYCGFCGHIRHETRNCANYLEISEINQEVEERWNKELRAYQLGWRIDETKENAYPNHRRKEVRSIHPDSKPTPVSLLKSFSQLSLSNPKYIPFSHNNIAPKEHTNPPPIHNSYNTTKQNHNMENLPLLSGTEANQSLGGIGGELNIGGIGGFQLGTNDESSERCKKKQKIKQLAKRTEVRDSIEPIIGVKRSSEQREKETDHEGTGYAIEVSEGLQGAIPKAAPQGP
ncbi:hypothetical protein AHAS_Ahas15G0134600 [Arachis hypogaea]